MDNLALWNAVADIDPRETKAIVGKPYKGTSPKPHYLTKLATEKLGPAGKGFGWDVVAEGFQPIGEELLHWCRIRFWWMDGDERRSFEEYGQTMALLKKRDGSFMSDEDAPKKSLTDARTKALSHIGFAANIFLGRWDDSKYVDDLKAEYREAEKAANPPEQDDKASAAATWTGKFVALIGRAPTDMDAMGLVTKHAATVADLKAYPDLFTLVSAALKLRGLALTIRDGKASASEADIPDDDLPERIKDGARMLAAG